MGERMDPRLVDRRRRVAEDRARSNLGRLMWTLVVLALLAGAVWLLQSPFLSVARIEVEGAARVEARSVLATREVVEGRPMVLLDIAGAQAALEAEPWVSRATVARDWPTTVVVEVAERVPGAVVEFADGPFLLAQDGTVLEPLGERSPDLPLARFPDTRSGEAGRDVAGAVEFLVSLPQQRQGDAQVTQGGDGLVATVSGFEVRLGRSSDMHDKALVTAELLDAGLEEGSIITVVAPASPAVLAPGAGDQGDASDISDAVDTTQPTQEEG